jgi:hypothetical protein
MMGHDTRVFGGTLQVVIEVTGKAGKNCTAHKHIALSMSFAALWTWIKTLTRASSIHGLDHVLEWNVSGLFGVL